MKRYFGAVLFFSVIIACSSPTEKYGNVGGDIRYVDISDSYATDSLVSMYDLVTIEEFVQLGDEEEFFLTGAKKIEEWGGKYILLDPNKQLVVAFDKEGRFVSPVGNKGEGPGYYRGATDFVIDRERGRIIIYSRGDQALLEFNQQLEFVRQVKLGFFAYDMSLLESGNLAFYLSMNGERDGGGNIWICDTEGKILEKRMEYPEGKKYYPFDYTGFLKNGYYTYPLSSRIYRLGENDKPDEQVMEIRIPGGIGEDEIFEHEKYLQQGYTDFVNQKAILNQFEIGLEGKELIFNYDFKYEGKRFVGTGFLNMSGQVFSHKNLKETLDGDWFSKAFFTVRHFPDFCQATNFFYSVSNNDILSRYLKKNKEEIDGIDTPLTGILKKVSSENNPVIIKFRLKEKYEAK
ncbi:6-bladed beta-propeller [Echinicola soli]|uniref:6-bladed beta-propeller n=1 Tax=Echinicola soli TaxID=2591634 RepID=A0A514CGT4_9BACT|nr:6-bladed beta-propeller [Echinicola soli]QDH79027.1 6-bladed beta-propeller [Echinicola soli]